MELLSRNHYFQLFLEDMKEKEKDMDKLNSKWEEGVSLGIDNPEIERRINKLNTDWDELCDLTEAKSNTANTALRSMEDYDVSETCHVVRVTCYYL